MLKPEERTAAQAFYGVEVEQKIEQVYHGAQQNAELYGMVLNPNVDIALAVCFRLALTDGCCYGLPPAEMFDLRCPCVAMRRDKLCHSFLFVSKEAENGNHLPVAD